MITIRAFTPARIGGGALFQGLGMIVYKLTGSFTVPLLPASAAFLFGAVQMWWLHGAMRSADQRPTAT